MEYLKLEACLKDAGAVVNGEMTKEEWIDRNKMAVAESYKQFADAIIPDGGLKKDMMCIHLVAFCRYFDELVTQFFDDDEKETVNAATDILRMTVTARGVDVNRNLFDRIKEEFRKNGL